MAVSASNTKAQLPRDRDGGAIQILAPVPSTAVNGTSAATSSRLTLPLSSEIILITNSQDTWFKFGASDVAITAAGEAGTFMLLPGERAFQKPLSSNGAVHTHVAILRDSADGKVCVVCLN